jgi:hypothetical protein
MTDTPIKVESLTKSDLWAHGNTYTQSAMNLGKTFSSKERFQEIVSMNTVIKAVALHTTGSVLQALEAIGYFELKSYAHYLTVTKGRKTTAVMSKWACEANAG